MNNDPPSLTLLGGGVNEVGNKETTWIGLVNPKELESDRASVSHQ